MARLFRGRRSENDVLIEMHRLRGELAAVRDHMRRQRASSFRRPGPTAGQLRNRAGVAILAVLALAVLTLSWLLYSVLAATVGTLFEGLVPEPVQASARVLVAVFAFLF